MSNSREPLLAQPPSDHNDRDIAEEDALLNADKKSRNSTGKRWREIGITAWAVIATLCAVVLAVLFHQSTQSTTVSQSPGAREKKNLIFMVSDGMGPTSLSLTRSFRQTVQGLPYGDTLVLDKYEIGKSRTRSSSSLITDSAAGATAFSCAKKSYNGAISMLPDGTACGTVMEAAKKAGYMTGLVVTTRITDATPACFASHVNMRAEEDLIAEHLLGAYPLGQTVDLMLGAGRCHFLPNSTQGSCRSDDRDLVMWAKEKGFTYLETRSQFEGLSAASSVEFPVLGLFALRDIPYEIDRRFETNKYPSLQEMTRTALNALKEATRDSEQGFFLMVEGSRIDHAGHANDPSAQVHEVLAYDLAFKEVLDFLEEDTTTGILVATSDHETGGLATAKQLEPYQYPVYNWFPSALANATHSVAWLTQEYVRYVQDKTSETTAGGQGSSDSVGSSDELAARDTSAFLRKLVGDNLGIRDATEEEIDTLIEKDLQFAPWIFADMISRRAQTGWSTHGHSAADVNIYASDGKVVKALQGSHENTEVGQFLADYLEVDLDEITKELQEKGPVWNQQHPAEGPWTGRVPKAGDDMDGGSHLQRSRREIALHE